MSVKVAVVDYGLGNLHSVEKALAHLGAEVIVAESGSQLAGVDKIVLPGVGAFSDGMAGLRKAGHIEPIKAAAAAGTPILGICLGAQLMLSGSEEFGTTEGLGLIPGKVVKIPSEGIKVPHVGWARLEPTQDAAWKTGPLRATPPQTWTYFVHSYHMVPDEAADLAATVHSGPHQITAAVSRANITGFQFHPEKSGQKGLDMLKAFLFA
ncbi:MAG: imidazole glycerol phosphate synthase subunit HisH [Verrucomicrobiaceae bacterium]|nr:imidazole glycerol phosphate synthase subunit HisH [Verrucomicrobiaceae bacterium]